MYGLYSVSPANNDPSDVLERRSSNSLLGRIEKTLQPWSEFIKEEGIIISYGQDDNTTLSESGDC